MNLLKLNLVGGRAGVIAINIEVIESLQSHGYQPDVTKIVMRSGEAHLVVGSVEDNLKNFAIAIQKEVE